MYTKFLTCLLLIISPSLTFALDDKNIDKPLAIKKLGLPAQNDQPDIESQPSIPLASLIQEPSSYVHGVNVITGMYSIHNVDLVSYHGVNPLTIESVFWGNGNRRGVLGDGWTMNHACKIKKTTLPKEERQDASYDIEELGCSISYTGKSSKHKITTTMPIASHALINGVSNTSKGVISGRSNIKNTLLKTGKPHKDEFILKLGTGGIRTFSSKKNRFLINEHKPTGNTIHYTHSSHDEDMPTKIVLQNKICKSTNSISCDRFNNKSIRKYCNRKIMTDDGRWVQYNFNSGQLYLESIQRSDGTREEYAYNYKAISNFEKLHPIKQRTFQDGRYLQINYYDSDEDQATPSFYRVKELLAPAGSDNSPIPIYKFFYHFNMINHEVAGGMVEVSNALGYQTHYHYNDKQRLEAVARINSDKKIYSVEHLVWGDQNSKDNTNLIERNLTAGGNYEFVFAYNYDYDDAGNVLVETLKGNLTGNTDTSNHQDIYQTVRVYSTDGFNLLLRESDGFITTAYQYAPGTNLLIAKYQGTDQGWCKRWFYDYNDDAALVLEIVDDGKNADRNDLTGVTERHLTHLEQSQVYPVAYPNGIQEIYIDMATNQEHLVRKMTNTYNNLARMTKQDCYDSEGKYSYTLAWDYDERGNLTSQIDALGRSTTHKYDINNNRILTQTPNLDRTTKYLYDFMNRLIRIDDIYSDGVTYSTSNRYDIAGNLIGSTDQYGNETIYKNDEFGRPIEIVLPVISDQNEILQHPTVKNEYDVIGNITRHVDGNGNVTLKTYNIHGAITSVKYPDGTSEERRYQLNGVLSELKARDDTITRYTNDCFGRVVETKVYSQFNELLFCTSVSYSAFHVLTETDAMGIMTHYSYYPDGKLKSRKKENHLITYFYDTLGRLNKTTEQYGPNQEDIVSKCSEFDLLGRVVEETTVDENGTVLTRVSSSYDNCGNVSQITHYSQAGQNVTTIDYDPRGVPIVVTDSEGNKTITSHNHHYRNKYGQHVAQVTVTDPLGNMTITEKNELGMIVSIISKNLFGKVIKQISTFYDMNGNNTKLVETIISPDESTNDISTLVQYDSMNRLIATYEAVGTPLQKQSKQTYNNYGQMHSIIKTDGSSLIHTYDDLGRLSELCSSDHSIHYRYHYDNNSNPIRVDDLVQAISTERQYDNQNRLTSEKLGNGLVLEYTHDWMGRPTQVILPDRTGIQYQYRNDYLSSVSRLDTSQNEIYTHYYDDYDLSGNLTSARLIEHGGSISYEFDRLNRLKAINTSDWSEKLTRYDAVGNLLKAYVNDGTTESDLDYCYDDLYQLKSEKGRVDHDYSYDSHYNRLSKDGRAHILNELHQLLDDGIYTYKYDLNGNMLSRTSAESTATLTYDCLDRLVSYQDNDKKACYLYDDSNRRLSKTSYELKNGNWIQTHLERYLYHGKNEIGACDEQGNLTQFRMLGIGRGAEIGAAVALEIGKKLYVPIHDHSGNVVCILDSASGDIIENYQYTAFGEPLFDQAISPWLFSSKRLDQESGFIYFGRRYYDPSIGRWITPDPIGRDGGPNLYAYVLNGPLTRIDLYGLSIDIGGMFDSFCDRVSSGFDSFCSGARSVLSECGSMAASGLESVGQFWREQCPIPVVQDLISSFSYYVQNGTISGYTMACQEHYRMEPVFGWEENPKRFHVHVPGMQNGYASAMAAGQNISTSFAGTRVDVLVGPYKGLIAGLIESLLIKCGVETEAVKVVLNHTKSMIAQYPGINGELSGFSMGGAILGALSPRLTKEEMGCISLTTMGSATMVPVGDFKSAENYVSVFDPVPFAASPIQMIANMFTGSANIKYLKSNAIPFTDHSFSSPTYFDVVEDLGRKFLHNFLKAH